MAIKVIAADSHPLFTLGIESALSKCDDVDLVGIAHSSSELFTLAADIPCDVLVIDHCSCRWEGFGSLMSALRAAHPHLKMVVQVCMHNAALLATMSRLGIGAVLHKCDAVNHLAHAIHAAHAGAIYVSPALQRLKPMAGNLDISCVLTARETEILRLFLSGLPVCEIARKLHRAKQTVSAHKSKAMRKLGVESDAELFGLRYLDALFAINGFQEATQT